MISISDRIGFNNSKCLQAIKAQGSLVCCQCIQNSFRCGATKIIHRTESNRPLIAKYADQNIGWRIHKTVNVENTYMIS